MDSHKVDFNLEIDSGRIEEINDDLGSEQQIDSTDKNSGRGGYDDDDDLLIDDTGVVVEDNGNDVDNSRWISGKSVSEMEEDLLNYDSDNDMDIQEDENSSNIRRIANELLQKPVNKVLINCNSDTFLLFDYKKNGNSKNIDGLSSSNDSCSNTVDDADISYPIICADDQINSQPSNVLMATIRQFLESYYGKLKFTTKEIILNIPSLDITLFEDNIYNNQVTFEDIQTIFRILKSRSEKNNEANIPKFLVGNIELRPRFVARYNTLVELTESSATLENIRPFSNDKSHPLVLDDNVVDMQETVVMNIDEDDDNDDGDDKNRKNNREGKEEIKIGNINFPEKRSNNQEDDNENINSSTESNIENGDSKLKDSDDDLLEIASNIE
ncbi:hypothetical protein RI543_002350 [Arxiozyma heterogenica]|uniref:Uncharacterized protein n=1 Tax=Arxiozyma heterogenica TaxID=278026 RepID=A0AAN7WK60_9SACH|nr:hypothetical protein RI543_002350 [Kazachstania heterogenica]